MTKLYDVKGAICEHSPQCEHICHFVDAGLEPEPRTVNLDEIEPVSDMWQAIASVAVGFFLFAIAVVVAIIFATGAWVWSLLI
jgi:hypothetical protein